MNTGGATVNRGEIVSMYAGLKEACPTILINKTEDKVCTLKSHGRTWTAMELAKIHTSFSCKLDPLW